MPEQHIKDVLSYPADIMGREIVFEETPPDFSEPTSVLSTIKACLLGAPKNERFVIVAVTPNGNNFPRVALGRADDFIRDPSRAKYHESFVTGYDPEKKVIEFLGEAVTVGGASYHPVYDAKIGETLKGLNQASLDAAKLVSWKRNYTDSRHEGFHDGVPVDFALDTATETFSSAKVYVTVQRLDWTECGHSAEVLVDAWGIQGNSRPDMTNVRGMSFGTPSGM